MEGRPSISLGQQGSVMVIGVVEERRGCFVESILLGGSGRRKHLVQYSGVLFGHVVISKTSTQVGGKV